MHNLEEPKSSLPWISRGGNYHIKLGKESHAKTTFFTPFGKYEFNMVPFGLAQAPTYFQALISKVLKELHKFAMAYLDDITIFSKNEEEHLDHFRIIFQRLKAAGLKLKWPKCDFMKRHTQHLSHLISPEVNSATSRETWKHQEHASNPKVQRKSRNS